MKTYHIAIVAATVALTAACAPQTKYAWGGYEASLYDHYKTPGDNAEFAQKLHLTISRAESTGKRVPPGIYAEYGNLLLESGDNKQATAYFEREKQSWPESKALMDTMIRVSSTTKEAKQW